MTDETSVPSCPPLTTGKLRVLACASQGSGGDDEARLRVLLTHFEATFVPFLRQQKLRSFKQCFIAFRSKEYDLLILEGTGIGAGLPAILAALLFRRTYVLSSGDAVEPFLSARSPLGSPLFYLYERMLYLLSGGFIGWTPYLVGRALTMGATRAMTCPGWAPYNIDHHQLLSGRRRIREQLGIPDDCIVFGLAGSLTWSRRYQYCYGLELIRARHRSHAKAYVLIVGDGSGLPYLKRAAGESLGKQVFLTGRVSRDQVPEYLAAMDVGSVPQSVDGVGSFRYTTKVSEYRSVGLPFLTNQNPVAYDLDRGDIWRLPGSSPWDEEFLCALTLLMDSLSQTGPKKTPRPIQQDSEFDRNTQICRVTAFLNDVANAAS